jgi:hypothetical protein
VFVVMFIWQLPPLQTNFNRHLPGVSLWVPEIEYGSVR